MADVARRAGVSHQTVSRVLNGHPNVSPETKAGVLAAIRALGYRPNIAARTLVTGKTNVLGVVSVDTTLYGPASMLYGIERALHPEYFVAVASLPAFERGSLTEAVERFVAQSVAGIIVIAPSVSAAEALRGLAVSVPLVVVGSGDYTPLRSVAIDNRAGAARATRHLLDLGHRTVYHIGGPDNWLDARERVEGWRLALYEAGAPQPELMRGDWSARSGYEIGHQLAARADVTAVLCANDAMALGFLRAAAEHGRRVPEDVSVVGFDDVPEAAYYHPPLTTVRQDFGALGVRALHVLMDLITNGGQVGSVLPIAADLIVRSSSGRSGIGAR
ncbi:MAG TPA: LacI family DNA-binding transcriptional regulator [Trebonia sp.]|jgi:DNA-binding LacI/PurR family transcriptional regulator|nr:LacI family DNA-binding transcriptional regulator [Trebonia sp.]